MFKYKKEHHDFIKENYKGIGNIELTKLFNARFSVTLKVSQIKSYKANRKLDSGITARFTKGQKAFNKGLKQSDYMSKEAIAKTAKTRFKKGDISYNTKEIGSEFTDDDGYLYIKVKGTGPRFGRNGMWQQYHHLVWMQYYGDIPEDNVIIFLDQNKTNFNIENLKLVDRKELLILNRQGLIFQDSNLTNAGVSLAKLISKHKELEKSCDYTE